MAKIVPTERLRNLDDTCAISEAVDISAADYVPSTGHFRALNVSVAGQITITKLNGVNVPEYLNTGWTKTAGIAVKHGASGDSATILAACVDG